MAVSGACTTIRCANCWRRATLAGDFTQASASAKTFGWGSGKDKRWRCPACLPLGDCAHDWREPTPGDRERQPWIPCGHGSWRGAHGVLICDSCHGLREYDTGE